MQVAADAGCWTAARTPQCTSHRLLKYFVLKHNKSNPTFKHCKLYHYSFYGAKHMNDIESLSGWNYGTFPQLRQIFVSCFIY